MTKLRLPIDGVFYFMEEIFKDIPSYEGLYQVSNLGNVKSLNYNKTKKEKILKSNKNSLGYKNVGLSKNGKVKSITVHQLVAMAFLNHNPCGFKLVIDHRNDNKLDNRLENLQVVTTRHNSHKTQGRYSSKYKGVHWHKHTKKWCCSIMINSNPTHLGYFNCELAAHLAYQNKLKEII